MQAMSWVRAARFSNFPGFSLGTSGAIHLRMRLASFVLVTGLALSLATTSHAQEEDVPPPPPPTHRSPVAFGVGIGLTSVGGLVIAGGLVCGIGGMILATDPNQGDTGNGPIFAMLGGFVWAVSAAVGIPMLVGGIVLAAKNAPRREAIYREAKYDLPAPRFMSVPILSASF